MKTLHQWILRSCLILCALLLNSCLDLREEFWIHEDGSAELEVNCSMPRLPTLALGGPKGVKAMAEKILEEEGSIDSYEVKVSESNKRVILVVHCQVDDLLDFDRLRTSIQKQEDLHPSVRKMMGEFNISLDGMQGVSVKRRVAPGEAVPALKWLPKSQTDGYGITKIVHFPQPIKKHNAHDSWDGGRTLVWETSLASAAQAPMSYEFVMPYPIPWGWIIAASAAVIALLFWIRHLLKARGRRRAAAVRK